GAESGAQQGGTSQDAGVATAAAEPTVTPAPTPRPTTLPVPTTAPTVVPTVAPARPTTAPVAPTGAGAASPVEAVLGFYHLVGQREFDGAARLWSARMQGAFPPAVNIDGRFGQTQGVTVERADVIALDQAAGQATVEVSLVEVVGAPGAPPVTRRYVGTWRLVRGPSGWLLDQPNLRLG
ncbi:MAG: hypothetical protein ACRDJN_16120, partial [Chloroflexota bacterium]